MGHLTITIAILVFACAQLATALPAAEKCSSILIPAPTTHCSAGSISNSRRALLYSVVRGNLTEFLDLMSEIVGRARCHPDYLSLNENDTLRLDMPSAANLNPPFTFVGESAYYLKYCFILNISDLVDSESGHHINGEQIYFDTELRHAAQRFVDTATALVELARSDPRLTEGSNCEAPPVTCPPFPRSQTNLSASQIRYRKLVVTTDSLKNYADKLNRNGYWAI